MDINIILRYYIRMQQPSFLAEIPKEYILMTNIKGKEP